MNKRVTLRSSLPLLLLLLIFLLATAVLLQVFAAAWSMSRSATDTNNAVQLCRNAAEAFAQSGDGVQTAAALGGSAFPLYMDKSLACVPAGQAVYRLDLETDDSRGLQTACFSVYRGETCLYTLTTQFYQREAQP
ncbi:MAG: hypothetical protein VB055_10305 [Oscillospiraceae bacterium]|nr:hypothetical protein [Oscillospiraceae bacterium]